MSEPAQVECHSGTTYAERPTAFVWQGERLEINEILASWHTENGKRFRVQTADGQIFTLEYFQNRDEWQVTA